MTATADLRAEVLDRLRALAVARPERTVHLTIDVVRYGASLPIPAVLATLESLRERGEVVHAGGGWRLRDGEGSGRDVWLVLISGTVVHSIHSSERGARARAADLDNFDAQVEQRRVED